MNGGTRSPRSSRETMPLLPESVDVEAAVGGPDGMASGERVLAGAPHEVAARGVEDAALRGVVLDEP